MAELYVFQIGWNNSQDGPGNRLLIHLQGCNLSCPWCCNPEGRPIEGCLLAREKFLEASLCPYGGITYRKLDRKICSSCLDRQCLTTYRNKALSWSAKKIPLEELVDLAVSSKSLFFSGGGVTVTGGEATLQFEPLKMFFTELKEQGINTALETNGTNPRLEELFPVVDNMIIDVKHYEAAKALRVTKNDLRFLAENLSKAAKSALNPLVRITIIPDFNDSEKEADGFISLFLECGLKERCRIEFLVYHEYGKVKWEEIGEEYIMPQKKVEDAIVSYYRDSFIEKGFNVVKT